MREVFQSQLTEVQTRLVEMAEDTARIIEKATKAFGTSDVALADEAIAISDATSNKALALDELVIKVLARQSPVARDLRIVVSALRISASLERMGDTERHGLGSSLKFCRIAEGSIDVYPRFGPTSEWDTAAAQCVLEAAGGAVLRLDGTPLDYNRKENILNPFFIALGDTSLPWRDWLGDTTDG